MINKSPYLIVAFIITGWNLLELFESVYTAQQTAADWSFVFERENTRISADNNKTSAAVKSSSMPVLFAVDAVSSGHQ